MSEIKVSALFPLGTCWWLVSLDCVCVCFTPSCLFFFPENFICGNSLRPEFRFPLEVLCSTERCYQDTLNKSLYLRLLFLLVCLLESNRCVNSDCNLCAGPLIINHQGNFSPSPLPGAKASTNRTFLFVLTFGSQLYVGCPIRFLWWALGFISCPLCLCSCQSGRSQSP